MTKRFESSPHEFRESVRADSHSKRHASRLRTEMTPPELVLWSKLRRKQLSGLRFRRQHPVGPYVADFYCHEARLVVEVDSRYHEGEQKLKDVERDEWMQKNGLRVLRVTAGDIAKNINGVLTTVLHIAQDHRSE